MVGQRPYDVALNSRDQEQGFINPGEEDDSYMPFTFKDLRRKGVVFFRAFLKSGLNEAFNPEWNEERYFGRVDAIPTYQGTTRTINVSFDMVAWSPKDLPLMYKKIQALQAMVYPLYDDQGFYKTGPIIRMRIGDLFAGRNSDGNGLGGYITALDFSYDDTIWNIEPDFKVPRKVEISLGFTVLHDQNPGLYPDGNDFKFGTAEITKENNKYKIGEISEANIRKIFDQKKK